MLDDPDWLLQHIRHSFITSDDTGMCEMVLQDSDMLTLTQHKERIRLLKEDKRKELAMRTQKKGLPESFGRSTPVGSPREEASDANGNSIENTSHFSNGSGDLSPIAPSPDIQSGWDFGGRRRSNTAQKLERIKRDKQNRVKVNSIPWRKKNYKISEEDFNYMFQKKDLKSQNTCHEDKRTSTDATNDNFSKLEFLPFMNSLMKDETPSDSTADHLACETIPSDNEDFVTKHSSLTEGLIESNRRHSGEFVRSESYPNEKIGRPRGFSALSKLLTEATEQYNNPFREYSRFDGDGQSAPNIRKINIFVWPYGMEKPKFSILIHVLAQRAKVQDVIGLTCWKYSVENHEPLLSGTTVQRFAFHIAEDDGTVDEDFPPLDANEPFLKFKFTTLALVEKIPTKNDDNGTNEEEGVKETVFVRVNDYEGFSMVKVDNLSITMGEILRRTLTRRKGKNFVGNYVLEYQDRIGEAVNEEQTLESTGVMQFYLVRKHSSRSHTQTNAFNGDISLNNDISSPLSDEPGYTFPPRPANLSSSAPTPPASAGFIFIPTTEYVTFRLNLIRRFRPSVPVDFGVGLHQVDIVRVERRDGSSIPFSLLPHPKNLTIRVGMLAFCEMSDPKTRTSSISASPPSSSGSPTSSKSSFANFDSWSSTSRVYEKMRLKLYYKVAKNNHIDYKHLTLEGPGDDMAEAVDKVNKVMVLYGDRKLQNAFQTHKFGMLSSTTSSSTTTLKRRDSLFR